MADLTFSFDSGDRVNDTGLQDDMEMASNDSQFDDSRDLSTLSLPRDKDETFKLDGFDSLALDFDDENDGDVRDYDSTIIGKKRKRTSTDSTNHNPSHSKQINARIKAEGGEALILNEESQSLAHRQSSRVPGTFGRHNLEQAENLPGYHKRVSAKLDSEDELLLDMREKGYSDRQIAEKLAKDGRSRYDQKSISTRIMRIRLAQAENFDTLLKEGYKEWRFEDDQLLAQAYALADIEISYEIERVRAWRFRKVSEYMRRLNKDSLFSANACRNRYGELTSGTARIPCDVDDDPDARREEFEEFRLSREAAREKEAAEKETLEIMEKRVKDSVKMKNAQKAEELANKRAANEQEKAQRAIQRAANAQLRMQKAADNQKAKMERNAQIKKAAATSKKRGKKATEQSQATSKKAAALETTKENPETIDPRSYLNIADLVKICTRRGLPVDNKTKMDLMTSLADADLAYSCDGLRKMCKAKGLAAGGTKTVMRYQLALKEAQMFSSFEAGRKAVEKDKGEDDVVVEAE